jgi:hypothetical protein
MLAAALLSGASAWLRGDDDDDDLVDVRAQVMRNRFAFVNGRINISERNVDSWIYGNESRGRTWLEASLKQKIDQMGRVCELSDLQKHKLLLAGKGDIQRFETCVDDLKASVKLGAMAPEKYTELFQKTRPLQILVQQGLFGSTSLFQKTLTTLLRPEQLVRYEQLERERRVWRYRARVEMCVAQFDAVLGLRDDQRRRLVQLILNKTRPPKHFGQSDRLLVLVQMSRLPEEDLKSILDPAQWPEMRRRLVNARRMLPALKQNGLILDEDDQPSKEAEARVGAR